MKLIGRILIGIGILDFALSFISDDWNLFVYELVGEDMMQFCYYSNCNRVFYLKNGRRR